GAAATRRRTTPRRPRRPRPRGSRPRAQLASSCQATSVRAASAALTVSVPPSVENRHRSGTDTYELLRYRRSRGSWVVSPPRAGARACTKGTVDAAAESRDLRLRRPATCLRVLGQPSPLPERVWR